MTVRWLVFDYGEVISRPTAALPDLAARLGVPEAEFAAAYWAAREPYDRGQSDLAYWRAVGGALDVPVDQALADELTHLDVHGWLHPDPAAVALLDELAEAGVPLALLSNAPSSFGRAVEALTDSWTRHFQHLVFSGDLGVAKPDARIWAALADRLSARTAECLFLDDRQVNIDGALAAGMVARRWTGAVDARAHLVDAGVLS